MSNVLMYFVIGTVFSFTMDALDRIFGRGDAFSNGDRFKMIGAWPLVWVLIVAQYVKRKN